MLFFFVSCSGVSGPPPTPSRATASCLIGIWQIQDPEAFLRATLPVGSFDPEMLKFVGSAGGVAYQFDDRGILTVEAVQFQGQFDVRDDTSLQVLEIRMSGFASSNYSIEGENVVTTEMLSSDMDYSAIYEQEQMMTDVRADAFLPLFVEPYKTARFTCSQESLALELINFPAIEGPLEFKRLR